MPGGSESEREDDWEREERERLDAIREAKSYPADSRLLIRGVPSDWTSPQLMNFLNSSMFSAAGFPQYARVLSDPLPCVVVGLTRPKQYDRTVPVESYVGFATAAATTAAARLNGITCKDGFKLNMQRPPEFDCVGIAPEMRPPPPAGSNVALVGLLGGEGACDKKDEELARLRSERDELRKTQDEAKASLDMALQMQSTTPGEELPQPPHLRDDPAYWGLRLRDLLNFRSRITQDMCAYCSAHETYRDDGGFEVTHICVSTPCPFETDHRGVAYDNDCSPSSSSHTMGLPKDMHLVVQRYVKPETESVGQSFALMVNHERPLRATTFVSHCWSQDFDDFASTLAVALDPSEVIWVAGFALNHHDEFASTQDKLWQFPFARALRQARQVVVPICNEVSFTHRLWCCVEVFLARDGRVPTQLWAAKGVNLDAIGKDIQQLDIERAVTTEAGEQEIVLKMLAEHDNPSKVSYRLQTFLTERLNVFKTALKEVSEECAVKQQGSAGEDLFRLRQKVVELERDVARKDPSLEGDHEFGEVDGALFGYPSVVPKVHDEDVMRDVYLLNGVCSFKCRGTLHVSEGNWKVGFLVRRSAEMRFEPQVVLKINGHEIRRASLDQELAPGGTWALLPVGEFKATGDEAQSTLELVMVDEDFEAPVNPQPKFGLYIDRVAARRVVPGRDKD